MKTATITLTIKNSFTGFSRKITGRNGLPAISTIRRALRESKASDCISRTQIIDEEGNAYFLVSETSRIADDYLVLA